MIRLYCLALPIFAAIGCIAIVQPSADGCAAVRRGDRPGDSIFIEQESAVIVWDSANKIEHFVRSAAFDTPSPDFGFLVPTPNTPELKEVGDTIFRNAAEWILPRHVTQTRYRYEPMTCIGLVSATKRADMVTGSAKNSVRILGEQEVGGFKTAILEADNTEALAAWLKDNGYSSDPELQSWLVPYVAEKWKITAFKIVQDPKTGQLASTKPVRMSFKTERPFFPYREPESKIASTEKKAADHGRLLRVFFVSDSRVQGKLGIADWHARVPWADQLSDEQRIQLANEAGIKTSDIPKTAWLTAFEDRVSPRPGKEEVYFEPAKETSPVRPPDIIYYDDVIIPVDLIVFGVIGIIGIGALLVRLRRRTKFTESAEREV